MTYSMTFVARKVRKEGDKMAMIDIKDLKKSFGNNHVLNGVNLSVDKGDIVAIIGSSGSGKSTLVRCIAGLEKSDTGQILLNGEEYLDDGKVVGGRTSQSR